MLELSHLSCANVTKPSPGFGAKSGCHSPPHSACEAVAFHDRSLGGVGMIPRVRMVASSAKKVSTLRLEIQVMSGCEGTPSGLAFFISAVDFAQTTKLVSEDSDVRAAVEPKPCRLSGSCDGP